MSKCLVMDFYLGSIWKYMYNFNSEVKRKVDLCCIAWLDILHITERT